MHWGFRLFRTQTRKCSEVKRNANASIRYQEAQATKPEKWEELGRVTDQEIADVKSIALYLTEKSQYIAGIPYVSGAGRKPHSRP